MSQDMLLWAAVRVSVFKDTMRQRVVKGLMTAALASPAMAAYAGDDLAGMGESVAEGATSLQKNVLVVAQFLGVVTVIAALLMAKSKKNNPQVTAGAIVGTALVGVCLIAIPEIIKRGQSQVGLAPVDIG